MSTILEQLAGELSEAGVQCTPEDVVAAVKVASFRRCQIALEAAIATARSKSEALLAGERQDIAERQAALDQRAGIHAGVIGRLEVLLGECLSAQRSELPDLEEILEEIA